MEPTSLPVQQNVAPPQVTKLSPLVQRYLTQDGSTSPSSEREFFVQDGVVGERVVTAPDDWGQQAVDIAAKLYFSRAPDARETSVVQTIDRVVNRITHEGFKAKYFDGIVERETFRDELREICIRQLATFNSPVWFNIGRDDKPQSPSACYLVGVEDDSESIMQWARDEAFIFKAGAGCGVNASKLRGSTEHLSMGGVASGPVSFMRVTNAVCETFKSGGVSRRGAKLVQLDGDHPDILDFIDSKVREEGRLKALADSGMDISMGMEGERNVAEVTSYQSANNSVRLTDEFMRRAADGPEAPAWQLWARKDGSSTDCVAASDLLDKISEAAHACADPGVMFHDTINRWHTTPNDGPIRTSNPCLPGDSLVDTSEGPIRIDTLAEMWATGQVLPYAFGFDREDALPVLRRITQAIMTKMVDEVVEVTTEKGVIMRMTPDHEVLTRAGGRLSETSYVAACDLRPGQSLRKIARWVNEQRSQRRYLNHRVSDGVPNGTVCQGPWMWEQAHGPIPEGMEVHHVNEDPTDDRLSNFELVDSGSHQSFHSSGERNGRFITSSDETLVEVYERALEMSRSGMVAYSAWMRAVVDLGLDGQVSRGNHKGIRGMSWTSFAEWIETRRLLANDRVLSVRRIALDDPIPVYDITVDDVHNFGVRCEGVEHSIVVKNCGETHLPDDSSCNLASINVLKFLDDDGSFDVDGVRHVVDVMTLAMDILVEFCELPNKRITERTKRFRWLGLGVSNMGASIMSQGVPYDSDKGRAFASSVMALVTGRTYRQSARIAERMGAFDGFAENRESMLNIIKQHRSYIPIRSSGVMSEACDDWRAAQTLGTEYGYRNAQATVIAPAGTTSFFMGCDTTGIEPAFSLVTYKTLAGGGSMVLVNQSVRRAAEMLGGYSDDNLKQMSDGDFSCISEEDASIFHGANQISAEGHIKMLAAVQPFISGAASKTVNLPNTATVEDIKRCFVMAWEMGVKCIAVYRDGCKARQVLSTKKIAEPATEWLDEPVVVLPNGPIPALQQPREGPSRRRLPRTRQSLTHKIHVRSSLGEHEGYVTVGMYGDGAPGEMFLEGFGRAGGFTSNALAAWATAFSVGLQYGVPLEVLLRKHVGHSDETGGVVVPSHDEPLVVRSCTSIVDYVARWFMARFGDLELQEEFGVMTETVKARKTLEGIVPTTPASWEDSTMTPVDDLRATLAPRVYISPPDKPHLNGHGRSVEMGETCASCKIAMIRTGSCWTCTRCFNTSGCG